MGLGSSLRGSLTRSRRTGGGFCQESAFCGGSGARSGSKDQLEKAYEGCFNLLSLAASE